MAKVIGVRFKNAGKLYFFDPGEFEPIPSNYVIVETIRGMEIGEVVTGVRMIDDAQVNAPLKNVIRIADSQDVEHAKENELKEKEALSICQEKIQEHNLDMKLVNAEYTFDNSKIQFYFTSNGRVDFRMLVKDLASIFKTRIDLRQIGVRDEAKMLGGLGPCGRVICCGSFLGDFQPVSIKMAKEQNLSLNPAKISGVCGRLMCCLKYEQETYENTRKLMPKTGKEVITPDGPGTVWNVNVIKETICVRVQKGDTSELKDYPMDVIQRIHQVQASHSEKPEKPEKPEKKEVFVANSDVGTSSGDEAVSDDDIDLPNEVFDEPIKSQQDKPTVADIDQAIADSPWRKAVEDALRAAEKKRRDEH